MKLIIDIPEEVVKAIQNGKDYRYDIHTAIAQGTSVSTEGDLISRSALKKAFENLASDDYNAPIWYQQTVFETIDNAPTVEYSFEEAFQKTVCEQRLYCPEKPHGKWIEVTKGIDRNTYECPFCGRLINCDKPRLKLYPFCHCGADMRGEGGNEE